MAGLTSTYYRPIEGCRAAWPSSGFRYQVSKSERLVTEDSAKFDTAPEVLHRDSGNGSILHHAVLESYFELDEVGSRVVDLLLEGLTFAEVVTKLLLEFDVSSAVLRADVAELVEKLVSKSILVPNS